MGYHNLPSPLTYTGSTCTTLQQVQGVWFRIHWKRVEDNRMGYKWECEGEEPAQMCSRCKAMPAVLIGLCDGCWEKVD